jgi:hypothetical protein
VTNSLAGSGDFALYRVEVGAGEHLIVQMHGDGAYDKHELYVRYGTVPTRTQYDVAGKEADQPGQVLDVPVTVAGSYYVLAHVSYDGSSVDTYRLRADTDSTLAALTVGQVVTGDLINSGDFDVYRLALGTNSRVIVQLKGDATSDANELYVRYGAAPTLSQWDWAAKAPNQPRQVLEIPAGLAGNYYVLAYGRYDSGSVDSYQLRADTPSTAPLLPIGQMVTNSLADSGDFSLYRVEVGAGEHLIVQMRGDGAYDKNELYMRYEAIPTRTQYDVAGKEADQPGQVLDVPVTVAGSYYVLAYVSYDGSSVDTYRLRADTDSTLAALTVGQVVTGDLINSGDFDVYRLALG